MPQFVRNDYVRMFFISGGAGPANAPQYEGQAMMGEVSWKQGDNKPVRIPSPRKLGVFDTIGQIPGDQTDPSIKTYWRYTQEMSDCLETIDLGCAVDLQAHVGTCGDPRDFDGGWIKIMTLENARITDYSTDKIMALEPTERAQIMETVPFQGADFYEIKPMIYAEQDPTLVVQEVVDITVADLAQCGDCGVPSDGCQIVYGLCKGFGGSPGLLATIQYSINGGSTWASMPIPAANIPANKNPDRFAVIGKYLVVTSSGNGSLSYILVTDLLAGTSNWTNVTTGIVVSGEPKCVYTAGPNLNWFGGKGGYLYFSADPTAGVTVQDAAVASSQDYNDIHGIDEINIVAVGASNAVAYTQNGGQTWSSLTGPNAGVTLNTVAMRSQNEWWIGDAAGKLWYTLNAGATWTQKTFPKGGAGAVQHIRFGFQGQRQTVGFMLASDATKGYILRTVNGGSSWYVAPEGSATMPTSKSLNRLAKCTNANVVFAGGLKSSTGAQDGIIIKGA